MKVFSFQIQNCIDIKVKANNAEEARMLIINNLEDYASEMISDSYVSDGEEVIEK